MPSPSPATLVTEGLGLAQGIYGAIKGIGADQKLNDLLAKRKSFVTPDEIYKILNATEMNAQGDSQTRDYQTGQIDRGFGQALGTATLLGADPNDLSSLFDQKMQGILSVGQQFHASNMEAFGKYLGALNTVADNKAAEWQSQQDILKDQIQAASGEKGDAFKNISGGLNTILSGLSADEQRKLYTQFLASQNKSLVTNNFTIPNTGITGGPQIQ